MKLIFNLNYLILLLNIQLAFTCLRGPSEQDSSSVSTEPVTEATTTTPVTETTKTIVAPIAECSNPAMSSGAVINVSDENINRQNDAIGTCPCSGDLAEKFYTGQSTNQVDNIADVDVQCTDMSQFCACNADGCFSDSSLINVQLFSVCDGDTCKMFAFLNGPDGAALNGKTVSGQFDDNGDPYPMTATSTQYFMPTAVSCNGCDSIQDSTCTGPYTAA